MQSHLILTSIILTLIARHRATIIGLSLASLAGVFAYGAPNWRIVEPEFPSDDLLVVTYSVEEFGARGDGQRDDTRAFQDALDAAGEAGGGVVYAPSGSYAIRGNLTIPTAVTLRGDWREPSLQNPTVQGTVLMAYAGRGNESAEPFVSLGLSAGIRDLSIWYPEQSPDNPVPYPYTLMQGGMNNATFKNLFLVNPYRGIRIGPKANELHYINNVYGTPLKNGIRYDSTTDIGRIEKVSFSPLYWEGSGLSNAPMANGPHRNWLMTQANGIHMERSDWEYVDQVHIDGYQIGFKVTEGERGAANAQFRRLIIRNCDIALSVDKTNPYGMVFTESFFEGHSRGVVLNPEFDSVVLFSHCTFIAPKALESLGDGVILVEQSRFLSGDIAINQGVLSAIASTWDHRESRVHIGEDITGAVLAGNTYANRSSLIVSEAPSSKIQQSNAPIDVKPFPAYPRRDDREFKPKGSELRVVQANGRSDATSEIQAALDALRASGGVVLLPSPDYVIRGALNIPSGVELRGVHDVPHNTSGGGSVLHMHHRGSAPSIVMEAHSGLRGMSFNYPEQNVESIQSYPFLIQGRGESIYIINVNAANPYCYLDLAS